MSRYWSIASLPRRVLSRISIRNSRRFVFAAGDVKSGSVRRVGDAVGEGAAVVALMHQYLNIGSSRKSVGKFRGSIGLKGAWLLGPGALEGRGSLA